MEVVLDYVDKGLDQSLGRLFSLLKLKSISTDLSYKKDCRETAEFLEKLLIEIGFKVSLHDYGGHPIVLAQYNELREKPHFLFYGHYDVQPVDPLNEWKSPPFEPYYQEADGEKQIVARGASDDKGQLMTFLEAFRAYKFAKGFLPFNATIILEGEEESGSQSLVPFLKENRDKLKADLAFICDTNMWDKNTPAITVGLRGMVAQEIVIYGPNRDLHSGMFGGVAVNPLKILSQILSQMHDEDGRILLDHFYDDVSEPPKEILEQWKSLPFKEKDFLSSVGLSFISGEKNRFLLENLWSRPTAEINGISGGYCGNGFKTVIPSKAQAKISFRLIKGQNPEKIKASFQKFVKSRLPEDCKVDFIDHGSNEAIQLSYDNAYLLKAQKALEEEWEQKAYLVSSGGSIPIVGDFIEYLNLQSLMIGFALEDDNIHSPNEKYNVRSFHKGQRSWVRIFNNLIS